jgi:hypothetical protein
MTSSFIYPEPMLVCLSSGSVEIPCSFAEVSAAVSRGSACQGRGVTLRELTAADVEHSNARFEAAVDPANPGNEAVLIRLDDAGLEVAAASRAGFRNASQILPHLLVGDRAGPRVRLRGCLILDRPHLEVRAVRLPSLRETGLPLCGGLVQAMAWLKYNTLFVSSGLEGLGAAGARDLAGICHDAGIMLVKDPDLPRGVIDGLDGPSTLDWEHVSRQAGVRGAAVVHQGALTLDELAASGFLFNLAYSASMLSCEDYNNFRWEKIQDLALAQMPSLMDLLKGGTFPAPPKREADIYPLPLRGPGTAEGAGARTIGGQERLTLVTAIGECADAIIFRHAIRRRDGQGAVAVTPGKPEPAAPPCGTPRIGHYTVRYADGEEVSVPLVENMTIGCDTTWCGRRLDPWTHAFRTDSRLRSLACGTRPVKRVSGQGQVLFSFDLAWRSPYPAKRIEEIAIELEGLERAAEVVVEQVCLAGGPDESTVGRNHDRV